MSSEWPVAVSKYREFGYFWIYAARLWLQADETQIDRRNQAHGTDEGPRLIERREAEDAARLAALRAAANVGVSALE